MEDATIAVRDDGETLSFTAASIYAYCGPTQIIASALVFRLLRRAFADLSPLAPPDRADLAFLTAFPGRGIAECVELVTRIGSRHPDRYRADSASAPAEAPASLGGYFYFEVQAGSSRRGYWPPGDLFDDEFRSRVSRWQDGGGTAAERAAYLAYKTRFARTLLEYPEATLFASREVPTRTSDGMAP